MFAAVGIGLIPWTIWLSTTLPEEHTARSWDVAWSGFDAALAVAFLLTALAMRRRSLWVPVFASATAMLLVTDAWFDIVLETGHARTRAIITALVAELPMTVVCVTVALRVESVVERALALHLAAARQGSSERDLVGVLEVAPDRQPAGEPGHSHPPA
jgi:hypothetical protein